jgi:3-methyladenine DNA glycosylase AlkD
VKTLEEKKEYIGTQYNYRGLTSTQENQLFKKNFEFQKPYNLKKILNFYTFYWKKSNDFHHMNLSLKAAAKVLPFCRKDTNHRILLNKLASWIYEVDNWAHSDALSSLLASLFDFALQERDKELISIHLEIRKKWNRSPNCWLRRQSIVSLLNYTRLRKKTLPFKKLIQFIDPLLTDDAFYVQRAVGWTLRETHNLYSEKTFSYIEANVYKISSIAFSAATEKIAATQKKKLLILRKKTKHCP